MSSTSSNRLAGLLAVALIVANAVSAFPMFAREDAVLQARGSDDSLTNAVRFQRGLPPLPPKPMRRSSLLGWLHADCECSSSSPSLGSRPGRGLCTDHLFFLPHSLTP